MDALKALREYLKANPLPSESQQIDRELQNFVAHITSAAAGANQVTLLPSEYVDGPESLFTLCFGLIMLSTDLHRAARMAAASDKPKTNGGWGGLLGKKNDTPKFNHMTLDQFEKQLLGVVSFSKEDLKSIYDDIKETPLI